jgi:hypothetical protein
MLASISALLLWLAGRLGGRAELELEVIALRHKLAVLRRQRPGRTRLFALDRLLWIWFNRVWPGAGLTTGTYRVPPAAYIQLSMGEARSPEHKF